MQFVQLPKLHKGDKVAIVSPSFAAPAAWPHVYQYALRRVREDFGLEPDDYPTTAKLDASGEERARDLVNAFEDKDIKAVIATLGGDDQVTYVKHLPARPFVDHPKPFFGASDSTHFANHLWLCGIPSFFGGTLFTEFGMNARMDDMTVQFLKHALFDDGWFELEASPIFNDIGLDWDEPSLLDQPRRYQESEGWQWDGDESSDGVTWGGCLESVDELLRHGIEIPSLQEFEEIVLFLETSEELPSAAYVFRVLRGLGERGILGRVKGLLVGRAKGWEFDRQNTDEEKAAYKREQREAILEASRKYNRCAPVVQNMDFGHTAPSICLPVGGAVQIDAENRRIRMKF
jgi:muramoyltetrapeptide carboxypeptidase LdcA involved in peptidoglycan recycling